MKKKLILLTLIAVMVFAFTACGGNAEETAAPAQKDFEGTYEDMGDGSMYIATPGGTSEEGNVPVLYAAEDDMLIQIDLDTQGMDGSKLSYIYIDGMENTKEQLAETQITLDLSGDMLAEGVHTVEVVQFSDDDPNGEVLTYKTAQYEVKIA